MRFVKVSLAALAVVVLCGSLAAGYRHYLISELRKPVLAELNDPDSAIFRNERYIGNWTVDGGFLCGEINAKNKMGGYVGYRSFQAFDKFVTINSEGLQALLKSDLKGCDEDLAKGNPWWWLTR